MNWYRWPYAPYVRLASQVTKSFFSKSGLTGPAREPGIWQFDFEKIITIDLLTIYYNSINFVMMKLPWSIYRTAPKNTLPRKSPKVASLARLASQVDGSLI